MPHIAMKYESTVRVESRCLPGVVLTVLRMSFGRRLELTRRIRKLAEKLEFLHAGEQGVLEEAEAALLSGEIEREYVRWGLAGVDGLEIDGQAATAETLVDRGPEELLREAVDAVRREAGLSEEERKNCESHSTSFTGTGPGGNATTAGS